MIGRVFLLTFVACSALATMLWFRGELPARPNPHPSFQEEELRDESLSSINRYLIPEIDKALPNRVWGTGCQNMVGFEELNIRIYCPTDNLAEIERDCMMAYQAACKGLKACKRLYNQTNHGPTSPDFIGIKISGPPGILAGVHHGKFFTRETYASSEWSRVPEQGLLFQSASRLFNDIGRCKFIDSYTTRIEQDQPAVGLHIWIVTDEDPTLEDGIEIYKKKYAEMLKWTEKHYPNHFLMLKLSLDNEKSRFGVCYYNVRNHVAMFEGIPIPDSMGINYFPYYQPNYLDDLVPAHLHRAYYKK